MIRLFKRLTAKEVLMIVLAVILICLGVGIELNIPDYMSDITKLLQTPGVAVEDLYDPGSKMIGLSLLSLVLSIVVVYLSGRVAASFASDLRRDVFEHVMDFSTAEIKHFSVPSLITRTTNDIVQLQMFIAMGLNVIVRGPVMAVWAMTKIADKNFEWLMVTGAAVGVMLIFLIILMTLVFPKQKLVQELTDKLNGVMRESLLGMRVVRAYNAEDYQNHKFSQANDQLTGLNLFINRMMGLMQPMMMIVSNGLTLSVYWIGAYLISAAALQEKVGIFSDMIVFSSYAMQVVFGYMMMTAIFIILPRTLISAGRINAVLDTKASLFYPENPKACDPSQAGSIEFDHVSFTYPGAPNPVIEDVSFQASAGQTVAFIGSTGSGKSTLISLVPRFYNASQGYIYLDGQDVRNYSRQDLNNLIGYIPQTAVLFNGDIASNLDFGQSKVSPLDENQMWQALDIAQGKDFVLNKEDQLKAHVSQGGTNFSGGQKQRLAIARAIARKPEFLIFDDSFSALDYKTDKTLRQALNDETSQTTKLIVAQRISTIMDADLILVLDQGKVVGQGTHQELLAHNQVYQEIAYSQLSKEELAHA
ncbi:ABC transporter ATP-binding protein [Eremococcus coleocola]|uniref:ABC transporter ATP-binding protein n=1 Tax=Eremococcus coleocola TaxID=88132 RepID=UPI0003F8B14F|nr:ABC transporter ATP-binding protein [Eremococcus coleocola]